MSNQESTPTANFISPEQYASVAASYFKLASAKTPASVTAQAARIAEQCQLHGLKPFSLYRALRSDMNEIDAIVRAANARHLANPNAPQTVSEPTVRDMLRKVFTPADRMMILSADVLKDIYETQYQTHHRNPTSEFELAEYVDRLVSRAKIQQQQQG